jgi:hypothetical protein
MNAAQTKFIERQAELLMHGRRMSNAAARAAARAAAPRSRGKTKAKAKAKKQVSAETARENLLDHAVRAGVINAGMRGHYQAAYEADPAGTKAFLRKIGLSEAPAGATQAPAQAAKPSRLNSLG